MKQLSAAAVERAMKLQDAMLRAMAKTDHIPWRQVSPEDHVVHHYQRNGPEYFLPVW